MTTAPIAISLNLHAISQIAATHLRKGKVKLLLVSLLGAAFASLVASAADAPRTAPEVEQLARDVQRASSVREVKRLQYLYSQFAESGMWNEMAALFSQDAEGVYGSDVVRGQGDIARHLREQQGGGQVGLPPRGLNVEMYLAPVVTLSVDGRSAQGRWTVLTMRGRFGGKAEWAGGMQVNSYIKEAGVWKIKKLHNYPQFAGPYETGWFSLSPDTPVVPYHYTPGQAGRPVPDEADDADRTPSGQSLDTIERRVAAMNDEDQVRNLQNIYGYYVDRKMWDDVADLFAADGALEIDGIGVYNGTKSIRRGLERDGPIGLRAGQVNDQIQLHTVIAIDPGGVEARARGMQLGMLTPKLGEAYWSISVFENRYVKQDGIWRIREMRLYQKMKADYYQGWARNWIEESMPSKALAPDHPSGKANQSQASQVVPVFDFPHPVTGQAISYPVGARVVGGDRLVPAMPASELVAPATGKAINARIEEARRKLSVSKAYDAVENISSTFGYYLDDSLWEQFVENMAEHGTRPQGTGFYVGRDHLYRAMMQSHTAPWSPTNPIDGVRLHLRIQPVINVSTDAKSAFIRTRMFLYYANTKKAGAWNSGMYPNDSALLEDGVWKMNVGGVIDETYFSSPSYEQGWAKPTSRAARGEGPAAPDATGERRGQGLQGGVVARNAGRIDFPPDIPWSLFDDYRRKNFNTTNWPEIKPMWFHYRNPVSGRTPPYYCPEMLSCFR